MKWGNAEKNHQCIAQLDVKRSLMNKQKRVSDRTYSCGTPLSTVLGAEQWLPTIAETDW